MNKIETRLSEIERWHGELKMSPPENDLEHTNACIALAEEVASKCGLVFDDLKDILAVHDVGEIFVGDAPQEMEQTERKKIKDDERKYGRMLLVKDRRLQDLFTRFCDIEDDDALALVGRFIDKIQPALLMMEHPSKFKGSMRHDLEHYALKDIDELTPKIAELLEDAREFLEYSREIKEKINRFIYKQMVDKLRPDEIEWEGLPSSGEGV